MLARAPFALLALALVACGGSDDDDASSNVSDLEAGRGALTRTITEALPVPTSPFIGASIADIQASSKATAGTVKRSADCTTTSYVENGTTAYQLLDCKTSTTLRFLNADGTVREEHADLDKKGGVDRELRREDRHRDRARLGAHRLLARWLRRELPAVGLPLPHPRGPQPRRRARLRDAHRPRRAPRPDLITRLPGARPRARSSGRAASPRARHRPRCRAARGRSGPRCCIHR